jgi:hypothetical protein
MLSDKDNYCCWSYRLHRELFWKLILMLLFLLDRVFGYI